MNRLALLPLALAFSTAAIALGGCGSLTNQVLPMRDGTFRAPNYIQAQNYCEKQDLTMHQRGNAPAQNGILFTCEKE